MTSVLLGSDHTPDDLERTLFVQGGVIGRDQALRAGLTVTRIDDLVHRKRWLRLLPEVYWARDYAEAGPSDPLTRTRAAWVWGGATSVVASYSAAWMWSFVRHPSPKVEIWIPQKFQPRAHPWVTFRRRRLDHADVTDRGGVLVTTRERTAVDLASGGCSDGFDTLARRRLLDLAAIDRCIARGRGGRGWKSVRAIREGTDLNPWSAAERRFHGDLLSAGLTAWKANVKFRVGDLNGYADVLFDDVPLIVEIDGSEFHQDRNKDCARDTDLVAAGWTVLRITYDQLVNRPDWVIARIKATLRLLTGRPIPPH